jgi:predicted anti-sigma-YlaC factor YlaD
MNCEELMAIVNNYVDGQIDPSVCQAFETHLSECSPCKVVVDTIARTITLYRDEEPFELPQEFQSCLQSALHEHWEKLHGKKADSD